MLKIQEIREIIKLIDQSSIEKFSYEADGAKLVLKKGNHQQNVGETLVANSTPVVKEQVALPEPTQVAPIITPQQPATQAPVVEEKVQDPSLHEIPSPMVGTFYAASSPEADPFVQVGDKVTAESIVCVVEAMTLFNEIEEEVTGEIVELLARDGQRVEYGQPLFLVKTN